MLFTFLGTSKHLHGARRHVVMLGMEFGVSEIQVKGVNMLGGRGGPCGVAEVGPVGWQG